MKKTNGRKFMPLSLGACLLAAALMFGCSGSKGGIKWQEPEAERILSEWAGKDSADIKATDLDGINRIAVVGGSHQINEQLNVAVREASGGETIIYPGGCGKTTLGDDASQITTLADFANCTNLNRLDLYCTSFSSLKGLDELSKLNHLTDLFIQANPNLKSIKGISKLKSLQRLEVSYVPVSDFSEVGKMTELRTLIITETDIQNLDFVKGLSNLKLVYLDRVGELDLSPLLGLESLEQLHYNGLSFKSADELKDYIEENLIDGK